MRKRNIKKFVLVVIGYLVLACASSAFAAEKPRISVFRFTNTTQAYWWSAGTAIELQDLLINELAASKYFHVSDRQELYWLLEQKFTDSLLLESKLKLKGGKIKGGRHFVLANVSAFEENTNGGSNGKKFFKRFCVHNVFASFFKRFFEEEQKKAYLAFNVKIIDADTGSVIDSRSIEANSSGNAPQNSHTGIVSRFSGTLTKQDKTPVGNAIRNGIIEITGYLECLLITKDEECLKKYAAMETKRKEKTKATIQFGE